MSHIMKFVETVQAIRKQQDMAQAARALPDRAVSVVERVDVNSWDHSSADVRKALADVKAALAGRYRSEAVGEMQKQLRECATRIDAYRAVLPNLAALAAIEFGEVARDLVREADNAQKV